MPASQWDPGGPCPDWEAFAATLSPEALEQPGRRMDLERVARSRQSERERQTLQLHFWGTATRCLPGCDSAQVVSTLDEAFDSYTGLTGLETWVALSAGRAAKSFRQIVLALGRLPREDLWAVLDATVRRTVQSLQPRVRHVLAYLIADGFHPRDAAPLFGMTERALNEVAWGGLRMLNSVAREHLERRLVHPSSYPEGLDSLPALMGALDFALANRLRA